MRPAIVAAVLLMGLSAAGCSGSKKKSSFGGAGDCPPPASTASAGNAQITARAFGGRYTKLIVIRAKEKSSGAPVHEGKVTVRAEMTCPHFMPLYTKKLQETSPGTYKAGYSLVMPGQWTLYITVRAKNGDATTSALPVTVNAAG
jgi:YtkA-like